MTRTPAATTGRRLKELLTTDDRSREFYGSAIWPAPGDNANAADRAQVLPTRANVQITRKTLAALSWSVAFEESGFKVLTARTLNDFAIIHDWSAHRPATRCRIYYTSYGTRFTEPGEAIRHWNDETKRRSWGASRRGAAAGPEPAAT